MICPACKKEFNYVSVTSYKEGPITYQGYEPNCPYCGTSVRNVNEMEWPGKRLELRPSEMAQEYNRAIKTGCKYCGADLKQERYLRPHLTGDCVREPMLSAPGKHAATSTPVDWRKWLDSNYHLLMMAAMLAELFLLAVLVALEWQR